MGFPPFVGQGLVLEGVRKTYGEKVALEGLSLRVPAGIVTMFLGPNGAGKTTTLKLIAGLLRPDAGTILVDGRDLSSDPLGAKGALGFVPDEPTLYERMTGREFLRFVGRLHGMPANRIGEEIDRWGARFDTGEFLDRMTQEYSHGMRQRVVFCAALLRDPAVLVVDEPLVGLDPQTIRTTLAVLRERASQGAAVLVSTHTIATVARIADRVGVLRCGRLVAEGPVGEVLASAGPDRSLEDAFLALTQGGEPGA